MLSGLHPQLRPFAQAALDWASRHGVAVQVTSALRTRAQQQALYDRYQASVRAGTFGTVNGVRYPAAPPGSSNHEGRWGGFAVAWDSTVQPAYQDWWNAVRRAAGWTVLPHDLVHAEPPWA